MAHEMSSFVERLRSLWNHFWFTVRNIIRFSRSGYKEQTITDPIFTPVALEINNRYNFTSLGKQLSPQHWHRNLATLWYLEQMLEDVSLSSPVQILEPGCQNFSRLPALHKYLERREWDGEIVGVELDAYVPVRGFHSLWDHAQYYRSLMTRSTQFLADDFFKCEYQADLVVCFYPFVSNNPALAWGIPLRYASADLWIKSFLKNTKPSGYILVIHQGLWEEEEFDRARSTAPLDLIKREELKCPFFSTKYPARFSLYRNCQ